MTQGTRSRLAAGWAFAEVKNLVNKLWKKNAARQRTARAHPMPGSAPEAQLPARAPDSKALCDVIDTTARYVVRNGLQFEELTLKKQESNPTFDFLRRRRGPEYEFYRYRIYTLARGLTPSQVEEEHRALDALTASTQSSSPPTFPEAARLYAGLLNLTGQGRQVDTVRELIVGILTRNAGLSHAICLKFIAVARGLPEADITRRFNLVYAINDVVVALSRIPGATAINNAFKSALTPCLIPLLSACIAGPPPSGAPCTGKIDDILHQWVDRGFFTAALVHVLRVKVWRDLRLTLPNRARSNQPQDAASPQPLVQNLMHLSPGALVMLCKGRPAYKPLDPSQVPRFVPPPAVTSFHKDKIKDFYRERVVRRNLKPTGTSASDRRPKARVRRSSSRSRSPRRSGRRRHRRHGSRSRSRSPSGRDGRSGGRRGGGRDRNRTYAYRYE